MFKLALVITLITILAGVALMGCGKSAVNTSASTPATAILTFGQMANTGKTVFASHCARCHGAAGGGGTGPAIIGAGASLGKYNTGQGLLDFVSKVMPANAPGSLSPQDYLNVLSYLLVQNNDVSADTKFEESQLINLTLK